MIVVLLVISFPAY
ncbi:type I toxin-antitoxin system Ibs family toxin [Escherichia coli]|nr:type I toxin-antitoxin system Ibs family toxin [Escherichia coli]MCN6325699.1 type I toxin-antitoxin system Ibs family toxin [Escherichia coli]MCN6339415.1 type I toxin-antitoxin system Ibs family toxin [Escherichia coli]QGX89620.1 type I toxin-antitoxin system Ibs family toxin [Escherichia coli]